MTTAPDRAGRHPRGDAGSVTPRGLVRLAVLLAVLGTVGHDAGSLALTSLSAHDAATDSATAAATSWQRVKNVDTAYAAALDRARQDDLTIDPDHFSVAPDGTIALQVRGTARTVLLSRLGPLRSWTEVTADSSVATSLRVG